MHPGWRYGQLVSKSFQNLVQLFGISQTHRGTGTIVTLKRRGIGAFPGVEAVKAIKPCQQQLPNNELSQAFMIT